MGAWVNTSASVGGWVDFGGSEGTPAEEFQRQ